MVENDSANQDEKKVRTRRSSKKEQQVTLEQIEGSVGGAELAELIKRVQELEAENRRLMQMVPEETEARKVSITLPLSVWSKVDEHLKSSNKKQGTFFGELIKSYFEKGV